tara:strand:- start:273 stop:524 length:252 start_codon:yes stop_codon:yes gene_type:complete
LIFPGFFPHKMSITTKNNCSLQSNYELKVLPHYIMNSVKRTQKDGDLNVSLNLRLAKAADLSVFFLYSEGWEVATIIKGGKRR